jgi:hypothetical protein
MPKSNSELLDVLLGLEAFHLPQRLVLPYPWVPHIPFAFSLIKQLQPKIIVELGVHTGNSFSAFCEAVELTSSATLCYGIDSWQGDEHAGFYDEAIYVEIANYIQDNYANFAFLMKGYFNDYLSSFSSNSIDLLHIDGMHSYEAVKNDFETWQEKLSDKSVVLFHDTAERRNDFGVWKFWEEIRQDYPSCEFQFGYGLGVLGYGKNLPENALGLIAAISQGRDLHDRYRRLGNSLVWLAESKRFQETENKLHMKSLAFDSKVQEHHELLSKHNQLTVERAQEISISQQSRLAFEHLMGVELTQKESKIRSLEQEIAVIRSQLNESLSREDLFRAELDVLSNLGNLN